MEEWSSHCDNVSEKVREEFDLAFQKGLVHHACSNHTGPELRLNIMVMRT